VSSAGTIVIGDLEENVAAAETVLSAADVEALSRQAAP